jgi:maltokinase
VSDDLPLGGGASELAALLGPWLARQEWAQSALGVVGALGTLTVPARPLDIEVLRSASPGLASVVLETGASYEHRVHVLVGWRPVAQATATLLRPGAVLGIGSDAGGDVLLYDALADQELCLDLLRAATGGRERAGRARVVQSLASHSALVYDERLFMKCYRVIEHRPRPEIEMIVALDRVGFNRLLAPVGHWSRGLGDLALVREFLPEAVEGKALALTSLRDLLARSGSSDDEPGFEEVGLAGGDLGDEMRRLGETTAELHLALAEAFGTRPSDGSAAGAEIRVHGDYHLRRVMRVDSGWLVAGFGDDPLIGAHAGAASQGEARMASPLEDVAAFFLSLEQAAEEATEIQPRANLAHARSLAAGWVGHNRATFLRGYLGNREISHLVPHTAAEAQAWMAAHMPGR